MSVYFYGVLVVTPLVGYLEVKRRDFPLARGLVCLFLGVSFVVLTGVTLGLLGVSVTKANDAIDALADGLGRLESETVHCLDSGVRALTRHGDIGGLTLRVHARPWLRLFRDVLLGSSGVYAVLSVLFVILGKRYRGWATVMGGMMFLYLFSMSALCLMVYGEVFSDLQTRPVTSALEADSRSSAACEVRWSSLEAYTTASDAACVALVSEIQCAISDAFADISSVPRWVETAEALGFGVWSMVVLLLIVVPPVASRPLLAYGDEGEKFIE